MGTTTLQEPLALRVDAAFCAELEQRWARHQQNPEHALDWDVVRKALDLA